MALIEIDGLPSNSMGGSFHGKLLLNNQMVTGIKTILCWQCWLCWPNPTAQNFSPVPSHWKKKPPVLDTVPIQDVPRYHSHIPL